MKPFSKKSGERGDDKNKIEEKGFVTKCYRRAGGLPKLKMDLRRTNKEKGVS
jgi:hypothetical protein